METVNTTVSFMNGERYWITLPKKQDEITRRLMGEKLPETDEALSSIMKEELRFYKEQYPEEASSFYKNRA
ncbi:MAG: hypothetical protein LBE56_12505 [Tannerella sp.]|jgi:hypothetical protein|nr:hypothetical protein [Tannerella sp.]